MKKKLALLLSMLLAVGTLAGCGSSEEQQNTSTEADTEFAEYSDVAVNKPVEEYVTLGEYNGVEVVYAKTPVTQEEIDALALEIYWDSVTEENGGVKDRAVQIGDTANIDYVGKKDGEAFSGGTSSGYNLTIGSGTFIDGFEDGLVGVMPGDTVDLDLTFPENYTSADLAGQAVVFTVTVNYIMPTEMEDAVVAGFGTEDFTNVTELKEYANSYLESYNNSTWQSEAEYEVLKLVMGNAEFGEIPEEYLTKAENVVNTTLEMFSSYYGLDAETYTLYVYGMELEDFVAMQTEDYAKQTLVYQAIANAEGLNISDRELEMTLSEYAAQNGAASVEEFLAGTDKEEYRDSLMMEKAYNFIIENAVIKSE